MTELVWIVTVDTDDNGREDTVFARQPTPSDLRAAIIGYIGLCPGEPDPHVQVDDDDGDLYAHLGRGGVYMRATAAGPLKVQP